MHWSDAKQKFIRALEDVYSHAELEAMFFIATEAYFQTDRMHYMLNKHEELSQQQKDVLSSLIERLKTSEPIQHIVGWGHFYGRQFIVNREVLIPRQETELLVDIILKNNKTKSKILDIGTGSGCIAVSLKAENPEFEITAVDISSEALKIAKQNADNNELALRFVQQDILDRHLWSNFDNRSFDIIVSNPPYVLTSEKKLMDSNVVNFDPALALYVSDDQALIFYEMISEFASQKLKSGGKLYFEINEKYGKEVAQICSELGFCKVQIIQDLQNKDRFVSAIAN